MPAAVVAGRRGAAGMLLLLHLLLVPAAKLDLAVSNPQVGPGYLYTDLHVCYFPSLHPCFPAP